MFTILIPTDYSKGAANAIRYALQLTKKLPCKIVFFHGELIPVPPNAEMSVIPMDLDRTAVQSLLEKNVTRILKSQTSKSSAQKFTYTVSEGVSISSQILDAVKDHKADLIIMGTQGASGLAKFLIGSNSAEVISKSAIPVLVVPASYRFRPMKKIMFASDLNEFDSQLSTILPWAKLFNASLEIFHVSNGPGDESKMISKAEQSIRRKSYKKIRFFILTAAAGKSVTQELKSTLKQHDSDMAILFRHEHNWLGRMFMKSITERLAFEINIPLMAFRAES